MAADKLEEALAVDSFEAESAAGTPARAEVRQAADIQAVQERYSAVPNGKYPHRRHGTRSNPIEPPHRTSYKKMNLPK